MDLYFFDEPTRLAFIFAFSGGALSLCAYIICSFADGLASIRRFAAWMFFVCACIVAIRSLYLGLEWVVPATSFSHDPMEFLGWLLSAAVTTLVGSLLLGIELIRAQFKRKTT